MRVVSYQMSDVCCLMIFAPLTFIFVVKCLILDASDIRLKTSDIRRLTLDIRHFILDIWHQKSDNKHQTTDVWCLFVWYLLSDVRRLSETTNIRHDKSDNKHYYQTSDVCLSDICSDIRRLSQTRNIRHQTWYIWQQTLLWDVWCLISNARRLMFVVWCQMPSLMPFDIKETLDVWQQTQDMRSNIGRTSDFWHQTTNIRRQTSEIRHKT